MNNFHFIHFHCNETQSYPNWYGLGLQWYQATYRPVRPDVFLGWPYWHSVPRERKWVMIKEISAWIRQRSSQSIKLVDLKAKPQLEKCSDPSLVLLQSDLSRKIQLAFGCQNLELNTTYIDRYVMGQLIWFCLMSSPFIAINDKKIPTLKLHFSYTTLRKIAISGWY